MSHMILTTKQKIRRTIMHTFALWSYLIAFFLLFIRGGIIESISFVLIMYMFLHFSTIELKRFPVKHLLLILFGATCIEILIVWYTQFFIAIGIVLFNAAIFMLMWSILSEVRNRKKISLRYIIHIGWYIFTALITLSYSFTWLGFSRSFSLSCTTIYTQSNNFIDTLTWPLKLWVEQVDILKDSIQNLSGQKVSDVIGNTSNQQTTTLTWNQYLPTGIIGFIETSKQRLVDQVLADRDSINQWICEFMIEEIRERYNNPSFQFSVILLLFLLIAPIVRVAIYVMEWITFLLLRIFSLTTLYKKHQKQERVDEIE